MESDHRVYCYDGNTSFKLLKWKTRVGSQLLQNSVILSYKLDGAKSSDGKDPLLKYKSNIGGTVAELMASEGDLISPGAQLLKIEPCTHPVIMKDLCAECGADLRNLDRDNFEKLTAATTFSMVHVVPELKVSLEQAEKLGRDDENRLLKSRKLVLLVDLDQTLIHTTNDNVMKELPQVHHFQLYGPHSPWYHTKLRPGTHTFLTNVSKYFELHICTFGARLYAHKIAQILDPDGKLFSHRILSRDECFDATSKTGNLKALFPRGDNMVCIIDDREDVWNYAPNVIHVKPYLYFTNTGDINAPPFCSLPLNLTDPSIETSFITTENECKDVENGGQSKTETSDASPELMSEENDVKKVNDTDILNSTNEDNKEIKEKLEESGISKNADTNKEIIKEKVEESGISKNADTNKEIIKEKVAESGITKNADAIEDDNMDDDKLSSKVKTKSNDVSEKITGTEATNDVEHNNLDKENESDIEQTSDKKVLEPDSYNELAANDDYLLYLEEILMNIHKKFYKAYDEQVIKGKKKRCIPDLKTIVPNLRNSVLKGCNIVYSCVIPTNIVPKTSRFWALAESLGAEVSVELVLDSSERRTTHIISSKLGTAKVNAAKKHKDIFIVNVDWLFSCAERWERTDERLFPLVKDTVPPFLDGHKPHEKKIENTFYDPITGKSLKALKGTKRTHSFIRRKSQKPTKPEDIFSERIFVEAGLSLSQDDIDDMDKEIDEACSEESEKGSQCSTSSDSSGESLSSGDYPKGWKRPRRDELDNLVNDESEESSDVETIGSVDEEMAEAVRHEFGS